LKATVRKVVELEADFAEKIEKHMLENRKTFKKVVEDSIERYLYHEEQLNKKEE
jgi:hypothetical protein